MSSVLSKPSDSSIGHRCGLMLASLSSRAFAQCGRFRWAHFCDDTGTSPRVRRAIYPLREFLSLPARPTASQRSLLFTTYTHDLVLFVLTRNPLSAPSLASSLLAPRILRHRFRFARYPQCRPICPPLAVSAFPTRAQSAIGNTRSRSSRRRRDTMVACGHSEDGSKKVKLAIVAGPACSGRGRVARIHGARLRLRMWVGARTSIPHRALSLSSLHCGRLLVEVGIWRVGSTVAESSGALCEPRRAGAAFAIDEGPGRQHVSTLWLLAPLFLLRSLSWAL
ncbi:hypothetical protein B0H13DRAFT_2546158 [Mycena leptocephala]|nr:hypothetical protein B0H13DRAFT_2546158 [Mycena leptocephala]